jgi:hypothetical protein
LLLIQSSPVVGLEKQTARMWGSQMNLLSKR